MHIALSINGLIMPQDFPVVKHEAIHQKVAARGGGSSEAFGRFAGAWNAQAYRFLALTEYQADFCASLANFRTSPEHSERHRQERDLFGFFCSGVSVFEATFYGLFSVGAILSPANFSIVTEEDRKKIKPGSTATAFRNVFPGDPIIASIVAILGDRSYVHFHKVRNIPHRRPRRRPRAAGCRSRPSRTRCPRGLNRARFSNMRASGPARTAGS